MAESWRLGQQTLPSSTVKNQQEPSQWIQLQFRLDMLECRAQCHSSGMRGFKRHQSIMAIEETSSPAAQQSRRDEERGSNWQRTVPRKTLCDDDQAREGHQKFSLYSTPFPYFP